MYWRQFTLLYIIYMQALNGINEHKYCKNTVSLL